MKKTYKDLGMVNSEFLINEIKKENKRQLSKFGFENVSAFQWMSYLTEEVGELAQAMNDYKSKKDTNAKKIVTEAIQAASLALKIAEMFEFE